MFGYAAVIFVIIMVVILGILAIVQKLTGIKIFDDGPMDDDWYHW